jgi:large subunit ribosomal protein L15
MDFKLKPNKGSIKKPKRIGRGVGSGHGKTSTRGHGGAKCRSGSGGPYVGFEGGQMPIYRRLPKRGFNNIFRKEFNVINIGMLDIFDESEEVNIFSLKEKGLIRRNSERIKLLGSGELTKKLTIKLDAISKSAKEKVDKVGASFITQS